MKQIERDTRLKDLSKSQLRNVQEALNGKGFPCVVDGLYGNETRKAFAAWKRSIHLGLPEIIGVESSAILFKPRIEPDWGNWSSKVSEFFTVGEVSKNSRERIVYNSVHQANVLRLAAELDKIRKAWGSGIGVTSWYRPIPVNRRIGSSDRSQHVTGCAADIYPLNGGIWRFQNWLDKKMWSTRALGYGAKRGFVHLDLRNGRIRWNY